MKRYDGVPYRWRSHGRFKALFFGVYRPSDVLRIMFHRGERTIVWCGSDILQLGWMARLLKKIKARHICENQVEQGILRLLLQQEIEVKPLFFNDTQNYPLSYRFSTTPHVFIHVNRNAELEAGLELLKRIAQRLPDVTFHVYGRCRQQEAPENIRFHGFVPEAQFDREIKDYQGSLRLHVHDGMAETTAKSVLMGQWPITYIKYPYIDQAQDEETLVELLKKQLPSRPNFEGREYYLNVFNQPL